MNAQDFIHKATRLRRLIGIQASLRWALRALWVGLGTGLAAWAVQQLTGWLPDPLTWWLIGLGAGLVPLVGIFFAWPKMYRLVWVLDRRFGTREQISTAWQTVHRVQPGELAEVLIADAGGLLDQLRVRFLRHGWFLSRDVLALSIVGILAVCVYLNTGAGEPGIVLPEGQAELALPPVADNTADSNPAFEPTAVPEPAPETGTSPQAALNTQDLMSLVAAAQKMGEQFTGIPETSALGDALQAMDMQQAAEQMQELAEQTDSLSEETNQQIAEAMEAGVDELSASSLKVMTNSLQSAQSAFEAGDAQAAGQSVQALVESLQQLSDQFSQSQASDASGDAPGQSLAAGTRPDPAQSGASQEFSRIQGQGEAMEMPETLQSADVPGSLKPGEASQGGSQTVGGQVDAAALLEFDPSQAVIVPYEYGWNWKNVVSRYFQPVQE